MDKSETNPFSGVGVFINRLGNDVRLIEEMFPLPELSPVRFKSSFYPKYTDAIFAKAIHELAGRPINVAVLEKSPSFLRLDPEQKSLLLNYRVEDIFCILEPQFTDYPEVVQTFLSMARRYLDPFPEFEVDLKYGAADLFCGTTLIEMKAYSVMNPRDLLLARNQVLTYACLAVYMFNRTVDRIEVINVLTGESWSWNTREFFSNGEGERFYWTIVYPFMSHSTLTEQDISSIKNLYQQNIPGVSSLVKVIFSRVKDQERFHRTRINQLENQLRFEIETRNNVLAKYRNIEKKLREISPESEDSTEQEQIHWFESLSLEDI